MYCSNRSNRNKFAFEDCNFNIPRSKENTARVVVWLMGVENSYTMEASFCGSSLGSRANTHFTTKDFEDIGQTFCETLLDYYNEDPRNVYYNINILNFFFCFFRTPTIFIWLFFVVGKNEIKDKQSTNGTRF